MKYNPIIIISVFRSGANLIKDILCQLPDFGTWPAENINFIWRHGNSLHRDDEFSINEANDYVKNYIRRAFNDLSIKYGYDYVVEKTENNTLRINFVNKIFPEAKFIFVVRDGRDTIASMLKRRHQLLDFVFLLKKALHVRMRMLENTLHLYVVFSIFFLIYYNYRREKKYFNHIFY